MAFQQNNAKITAYPLLPLQGAMLFPQMALNFDVGRAFSLAALEAAMEADRQILLVTQKKEGQPESTKDAFYPVGTLGTILQIMNLPGDVIRILVEGSKRVPLDTVYEDRGGLWAGVREDGRAPIPVTTELIATHTAAKHNLADYIHTSEQMTPEALDGLLSMEDPEGFADAVASSVLPKLEDRMDILCEMNVQRRLELLSAKLLRDMELADIEKSIQLKIKKAMEKNQKDYYLREQLHAVQTELGEGDGSEAVALRERMEKTNLNEEARDKCLKEIERLSKMSPGTPEITMSLNYIEWILDLPWDKTTEDNLDLESARKVLSEDHYGLEKVKERIIEYLAVLQVKKDLKGPILCFVGPPGVGKTSIVRAIAKAVGRKFVQMSLGGVRDEAEIRGHRRTYLGAIPGRIISGLRQAGVQNPVFLFDEIDKMGSDSRGDPASALLEVLDAEQNNAFRDHYMEIPFDLSKVMFITTANSTDTIPAPLFDRMEIIEVPSYTEEEKLQIASRHLFSKQLAAHGLSEDSLSISKDQMRAVIEGYTREAGVRTLERTLAKLVRKSVVEMLDTAASHLDLDEERIHHYLGAVRYTREMPEKEPRVGIVNGLAYTEVGGETLEVECTTMPGKGKLQLTGKLGDVMKESAEAAFSWVRAHSAYLGLDPDFYSKLDVHIHLPEGAIKKDGPSAGVTLITCLSSALTGIPVRQDVAMTGEITLRGRVFPIGGLKEKTLAAYRAGIQVLIIPKENVKDLEEIPAYVLSQFRVVPAETIEEVLKEALIRLPEPYQAPDSAT